MFKSFTSDITDDSGATSSPEKSTSSGCVSPRSACTVIGAYTAATAMPVILENGRKVFGPPADYDGPRPSYMSELYITHVPKELDELSFLVWLHRCGVVYEFRLMMDSGSFTRGYAFVRYMEEREALAAYELINFLFINGERMSVYRSQGKNRLYVSNIPKQIPLSILEAGFRKTFPDMQSCSLYTAKEYAGEQNRGYAFIEFIDHEKALEAKKRTTPGRVRMWDCDLKVQWAKPKQPGSPSSGQKLEHNSSGHESFVLSHHAQNDYCAKLRLFCLANNWCIPVVVFGRNFRQYGVQYGAILLRDFSTNAICYLLFEVAVEFIYDIHVLMCEIAVQLFDLNGGFPKQHYIVRTLNASRAEIICTSAELTTLLESQTLYEHLIDPASIQELGLSLQTLGKYSTDAILKIYKFSFLDMTTSVPTIQLNGDQAYAKFYSIFPKYRHNPPLNNDFNDTEITLVQANAHAKTIANNCNLQHLLLRREYATHNATGSGVLDMLRLKSQRFNINFNYRLQYVDANKAAQRAFYHPAQQINSHPIWIPGHTYKSSLYKV